MTTHFYCPDHLRPKIDKLLGEQPHEYMDDSLHVHFGPDDPILITVIALTRRGCHYVGYDAPYSGPEQAARYYALLSPLLGR